MRTGRYTATFALLALAATLLLTPVAAIATPITDGLVLWLDADDADTVTNDAGGRVGRWADKSGQGNHAQQTTFSSRPQYRTDALGG